MLLTIDAGNTNTVFALCDGDTIQHVWRCESNASRTGDEYASWLYQVFQIEGHSFSDVTQVIISSVVPDANFNLQKLTESYFQCEARFVTVEEVSSRIGVSIDYPEQAGADLLVNAIGCSTHHAQDALIIDFGTATTLSVITKNEGYSGGIIAPGVNLSLNALVSAAAKLPKVSIKKPLHVQGKNTVHAMQSGIFWGYVSMIEGLITRLQEENSGNLKVIATGGLADIFSPYIGAISTIDHDLTLKGLIEIAKA